MRSRLYYAFGGGYIRNELWTLSLRKFLTSGEKKILAHEIAHEHLGDNINQ